MAFFLIGFILSVYLDLNVLAVSLLGLGIAAGISVISKSKENTETFTAADSTSQNEQSLLKKKDLWRVFVRSFFSMASINYERYISLGFGYAMVPASNAYILTRANISQL